MNRPHNLSSAQWMSVLTELTERTVYKEYTQAFFILVEFRKSPTRHITRASLGEQTDDVVLDVWNDERRYYGAGEIDLFACFEKDAIMATGRLSVRLTYQLDCNNVIWGSDLAKVYAQAHANGFNFNKSSLVVGMFDVEDDDLLLDVNVFHLEEAVPHLVGGVDTLAY